MTIIRDLEFGSKRIIDQKESVLAIDMGMVFKMSRWETSIGHVQIFYSSVYVNCLGGK